MPRPSKKSSTPRSSEDHAEAGRWMYLTLASYGVDAEFLTKPMGYGMLSRLRKGMDPEQAATEMGLMKWKRVGPTKGQTGYMDKLGLPWQRCKNKRQAGMMLDAHLEPLKLYKKLIRQIDKALSRDELVAIGLDIRVVRDVIGGDFLAPLREAWQRRREELNLGIPE